MKSIIVKTVFWAAYLAVVVLLWSHPALAWGPGAHIECSHFILEHLVLLAPAIRALLRRHPFEFIYGSVCPDMVLGKRLMSPERNNHNWRVGFSVLASARTSGEEAFALGYLSHLAADTIAHNHFIPDRILHQFDRRRRGHVIQELLFDAMIDDEVWATARTASYMSFAECDRLLISTLPRTPLPKTLCRELFHGSALLVKLGGWQRVVKWLRSRWTGELDRADHSDYLQAIHETVLEFLMSPETAPCLKHPPTGEAVLPRARDLRRTLRRMNRRDSLGPEQYSDLVAAFQTWRCQALEPETAA